MLDNSVLPLHDARRSGSTVFDVLVGKSHSGKTVDDSGLSLFQILSVQLLRRIHASLTPPSKLAFHTISILIVIKIDSHMGLVSAAHRPPLRYDPPFPSVAGPHLTPPLPHTRSPPTYSYPP